MDGTLLESPGTPVITAIDHGVVVGDGVFETVQYTPRGPFALTRHLDRLVRSARGLGLAAPDVDHVRTGIDEALEGLAEGYGRIRITVTSGPGPLGSPRGDGPATVVVAAEPMEPMAESTAVVTVPWARNERGALAGVKSTSYAENALMVEYAKNRGATEALMANTLGHVCEGTGSNVFYERDGRLVTPTLDSGCLAGVTRALILEWCAGEVEIVERDEPMSALVEATELFIASTARNVMAVHSLDGESRPAPGPLTKAAATVFEGRMTEVTDP